MKPPRATMFPTGETLVTKTFHAFILEHLT